MEWIITAIVFVFFFLFVVFGYCVIATLINGRLGFERNKNTAVLLAVIFGAFGIHNAYLSNYQGVELSGKTTKYGYGFGRFLFSCGMLFFVFLCSLTDCAWFPMCLFFMMVFWGIIDAIKLHNMTDEEFVEYRKMP